MKRARIFSTALTCMAMAASSLSFIGCNEQINQAVGTGIAVMGNVVAEQVTDAALGAVRDRMSYGYSKINCPTKTPEQQKSENAARAKRFQQEIDKAKTSSVSPKVLHFKEVFDCPCPSGGQVANLVVESHTVTSKPAKGVIAKYTVDTLSGTCAIGTPGPTGTTAPIS
jgi:hypothetical protein